MNLNSKNKSVQPEVAGLEFPVWYRKQRLDLSKYINSMFDKDKVVVAAMSGGVDSSVTAALMCKAGYKVIGLTLKLHDNPSVEQAITDAKKISEFLGIEHRVLDLRKEFDEHVLSKFYEEYEEGKTPNPCIKCNKNIKFEGMVEYSKSIGAGGLVTGHYIKREMRYGEESIVRGADSSKDQSYFLSLIDANYVPFVGFPLGIMNKSTVRRIARIFDLFVAKKAESQDLCFAVSNRYHDVLRIMGSKDRSGEIVNCKTGKVLGEHDGISRFTIGQRKGLNLPYGPWFVNKIDNKTNQVFVGRLKDVQCHEIWINEINLLRDFTKKENVRVKIRGSQTPVPAKLEINGKEGRVILENAEYGISPGQVCGFYYDDILFGGGYIVEKEDLSELSKKSAD
ncbi:tRNA 2-thiouridine(34) synthase MnmA [Candidatus Nesciobacter abundans]|uniref:tRNA-specific 2-thiouridylase MnmA n=1 Tax=Candidatus Nesciobacter abundans TaxID=2601668 RepID=A0A5C0UG42_9PROT|nr:tRNA 2-thiouridine(34) synthase MnmA [Candidatus Nesciobacter abundans]QEK39065.1 tRNA 2-thiouridine(34) synthase MnmA [Candidatus Nesciobacter abundans]